MKPNAPDLLITQAALIYRLQQDIYKVFNFNIAKPEPFWRSREGIAVYGQAFEAVEKLFQQSRKFWFEQKNKDNIDGTALGGMMTFACQFWITTLFAPTSSFPPLQLCVLKNNFIVASPAKEKVIAEARQYTDLFLHTGDYRFEESHWPYVDVDRVLDEYREVVKTDGSLTNLLMRKLRDQPDSHDDKKESNETVSAAVIAGLSKISKSGWSKLAHEYSRDNMRTFNLLLVNTLETVSGFENSSEIVAHFARTACAIAVGLRSDTGIDLCTLTFPITAPPLPPSHPLMVLLPPIEHIIEVHLKSIADGKSGDPALPDYYAKFHTALVWKAYLLLLNTPPGQLGHFRVVCAQGAAHPFNGGS